MTTITLEPGDVFTFVHGGLDIPVTGSPPAVWSDGNDATYATAAEGPTSSVDARSYFLVPDPGDLDGPTAAVTYHARMSTDAPTPAMIEIGIFSDDFSVFMLSDEEMLEVPGGVASTPTWYASPLVPIPDPAAFAVALNNGTLCLLAGQTLSPVAGEDTWTYIHEVYVVCTLGTRVCLQNAERSSLIQVKHPDGTWACLSLVGV